MAILTLTFGLVMIPKESSAWVYSVIEERAGCFYSVTYSVNIWNQVTQIHITSAPGWNCPYYN